MGPRRRRPRLLEPRRAMTDADLDIFLAAPPGLEPLLAGEASALGFGAPSVLPGGVAVRGGWPDVWRANFRLRGASRVLVRLAQFRAPHLAVLDKRARRIDWAALIRPGTAVRVEATSHRSRIWHGGAAAQRVARAIADATGAERSADTGLRVLVRLEDDLCTLSLDSSGEPLHRRGIRLDVGKAPLRETLAALFLRACGYTGAEPVLDPMCGSGTVPIEAAEIALGLAPGRARSFAFEDLASFDPAAWAAMRGAAVPGETPLRFHGMDRDAGAIETSRANALRASVEGVTAFHRQPLSAFAPLPDATGPGLVFVNPPYGERLGDRDSLFALHATLGRVLAERFAGWRVGIVSSDTGLVQATGLPFEDIGPPVPHGPLKIRLHRTGPLPG